MDRPGINVIGHVGANLGVGVVTRQVIGLVERAGYPVAAFDVDTGTRRARTETAHERVTVADARELPYRINLFVLGLGSLDWTLKKCPDAFFDGSHLNAVICFWELPTMSAARCAHLDAMDIVIGASEFLRHVYQQSLTHATVLGATLPISLPAPLPFDRSALGIPATATLFGFGFDPTSDPVRKNPQGAVAAFMAGVGSEADAWLLIRINNAKDVDGRTHPIVVELEAEAARHPRIRIVTAGMTYPQILGLYRACDVYVSLHRAEGLGLGMAEAMTLGVPVIATDWSGNTTFMRHSNSCLVDYELVPVRGSVSAYRERDLAGDARWAEPDLSHAAAFMQYLLENPIERVALGEAGRAAMQVFNETAHRAAFLEEIVAVHRSRQALRVLGYAPVGSPGRPVLRLPQAPLLERVGNAAADLGKRIANRSRKILTARSRSDSARNQAGNP